MPIQMCISLPKRDEILFLMSSNTKCALTRVGHILDDRQTFTSVDLGAWFVPLCPTQYSVYRNKLYIPLANGKDVLEIDNGNFNKRPVLKIYSDPKTQN
jgi:phage terminase small subunit